jgi:photosystem II stability/assembly factor-like uncharacterized protein
MLRRSVHAWASVLVMALALLAGCGGSTSDYGGNKNHVHDLAVLGDKSGTVLVASHIGLYRSTDHGQSWAETAGGAGQIMDGLMLYKLAVAPADPAHVYLLAGPRPDDRAAARDVTGIYASADSGATWHRASTADPFGGTLPYTLVAGAGSVAHVYALRQEESSSTLYESTDGAVHWQALPKLPISSVNGLVADPDKPGRLYLYSVSTGLYETADNGAHWQTVPALKNGIFSVAVAGQTVWANGDTGLAVSHDGGATFTSLSTPVSMNSIVTTAHDPNFAWGVAGSAISATPDQGASWKTLATPPHAPGVLFAPSPTELWSAGSYPLTVARTTDSGASWQTLLP